MIVMKPQGRGTTIPSMMKKMNSSAKITDSGGS